MKVKFTGTVERVIKGGFKVVESRDIGAVDPIKTYATVWTDTPVTVGAVVEVTGEISVRIEKFEGRDGTQKQVAAIHINGATVKNDAPF
jgi:Rieske Fe-S protein